MAKTIARRAPQAAPREPAEQPTITAGDIVKKLIPLTRRATASTLMERVRAWTKEKFLVPIEGWGQGPGKHARYAPDVVYLAAVLNTLAEQGLQIWQQRKVIQDCAMLNPLQNWKRFRAKGQSIKLLLMISRLDGEHISIAIQLDRRLDAPAELPDDDFSAVINLGRIWARLEEGGEV
jgi:hypothetical protein